MARKEDEGMGKDPIRHDRNFDEGGNPAGRAREIGKFIEEMDENNFKLPRSARK